MKKVFSRALIDQQALTRDIDNILHAVIIWLLLPLDATVEI